MCISIVFGVKVANGKASGFIKRVEELGRAYEYGIRIGRENLLPGAEDLAFAALAEPEIVFEVHDLAEPHCACDIDNDIRNGSKLGRKSKFFDFVREILQYGDLKSVSVLFFEEILPHEDKVRRQVGTYEEFVELLNRWNTWQIEGFEPTRRAYFIAEATPLLFIFTDKKNCQ